MPPSHSNGATLNVFNLRQFTTAGSITVPFLPAIRSASFRGDEWPCLEYHRSLVLLTGPPVRVLPNTRLRRSLTDPCSYSCTHGITPEIALLNPSLALPAAKCFHVKRAPTFTLLVVQFNRTSRTHHFYFNTQLQAATASDLASAGVATITGCESSGERPRFSWFQFVIGTTPGTNTTGAVSP